MSLTLFSVSIHPTSICQTKGENRFEVAAAKVMGKSVKSATIYTLREESRETNVILQYKLLASILSAVCSVIQQS